MRVFVQKLDVVARHGVYDDERAEGRRFRIDLAVQIPDADEDDISDTVNYCDLATLIHSVAKEEQFKLVETVARTILERAFSSWPDVSSAEVTVRKKPFGVVGDPKWVGVTLARTRS